MIEVLFKEKYSTEMVLCLKLKQLCDFVVLLLALHQMNISLIYSVHNFQLQ